MMKVCHGFKKKKTIKQKKSSLLVIKIIKRSNFSQNYSTTVMGNEKLLKQILQQFQVERDRAVEVLTTPISTNYDKK